MNSQRLTAVTAIGLTLVAMFVGGFGSFFLVNAISRSNQRLQLANNAEYGKRFAAALEAQLLAGTPEEEVLRFLQASFASSPGDVVRYLCVVSEDGEVLCHPRLDMVGDRPKLVPINGSAKAAPEEFQQFIESGRVEGFLVDARGNPVELVRRIQLESVPWQVLVHTNLSALRKETDQLRKTVLAVMLPTGLVFVFFGTLVVRALGRGYEQAIEEANSALERRVEERTRQLEETIAALQRTKDELQTKEKLALIGQFLSGITHEIRTPLAAISLQAQALAEDAENPFAKQSATAIQQSVDRCEALIRNLLAFARDEKPVRQPVEIRPIIDSAVTYAGIEIERRNASLELDLRGLPEGQIATIDSLQVEQIIVNLLHNGAQATALISAPGQLRLTVSVDGENLRINVEDNGPGVAPEIRDRIFRPFETTKRLGKGNGLGLSLCRRFIEAHGGQIDFDRTRSTGASFTATIPLRPAEP